MVRYKDIGYGRFLVISRRVKKGIIIKTIEIESRIVSWKNYDGSSEAQWDTVRNEFYVGKSLCGNFKTKTYRSREQAVSALLSEGGLNALY